MPRVIGAVPLFGCAFRLGLLVSVTAALACDGHTQLTPPSPFGPAISSVTPATGATSGATAVTIVGLRFEAGASVTFGGATATVNSLSSTSITATTEGHAPGTVDVVVTNPDGQAATAAGRFTFRAPPVVTSISPNIGSTDGRTPLFIRGSGFLIGATVTLDGAPLSTLLDPTATGLLFTARAHAAGIADVVVRNPDGQFVTLSAAYTFVAPETFDFNGNWFAFLGDGNDDPFSFKVEGNALVSLTCYEGTPVTLPSPLPINHGEVAASVNGIVIFSALFAGSDSAVGTINAGLCHSQEWYGWKDQQGTARLSSAVLGPSRRHK
jgi:hypothetical protein